MGSIPSYVRWLTVRAVAYLPAAAARRWLYQLGFGYRLRGSTVGFGTVIDGDGMAAEGVSIGRFNRFVGSMTVDIGPKSLIGDRNVFICGAWARGIGRFERRLRIGAGCLLTGLHHFDVTGCVEIGDRTTIAGCGSQFWTHGAGVMQAWVRIGQRCYIGSATRFAPGAEVGDRSLVAIGSVVTSALRAEDALIGGVPARILKQPYSWAARED